jgi:hypothetical protein
MKIQTVLETSPQYWHVSLKTLAAVHINKSTEQIS